MKSFATVTFENICFFTSHGRDLVNSKMASNREVAENSSSDEETEDYYSSNDDFNFDKACGGYVCEPEYSVEELKNKGIIVEVDDEEASSESENELDSSRLENIHWCTCTHCSVMPSLVESQCCKELANLLESKLNKVAACITEHEEFETLCLNKIVLNTAFIQFRIYKKNFKLVKEMNNK